MRTTDLVADAAPPIIQAFDEVIGDIGRVDGVPAICRKRPDRHAPQTTEHIGEQVEVGRGAMLASLAGRRDELRILWRDVEQFPDLQATARREIMQGTYAAVAAWLTDAVQKGLLAKHDSEAVAAVLVGSLAMFRVFPALWGEKTIEVDDERFVRAWSQLAARGLGLTHSTAERATAPESERGECSSMNSPTKTTKAGQQKQLLRRASRNID